MSHKLYFVLGPEGSGTYMMAEALKEAGCHYMQAEEAFYDLLELKQHSRVVIRRSLPHAGNWINPIEMWEKIWDLGYQVKFIIMCREPNATVQSVKNRSDISKAKLNLANAWRIIGELANRIWVHPIPYEAVVGSEGFRRWLFNYLELDYPENYQFYDGNEKYYG